MHFFTLIDQLTGTRQQRRHIVCRTLVLLGQKSEAVLKGNIIDLQISVKHLHHTVPLRVCACARTRAPVCVWFRKTMRTGCFRFLQEAMKDVSQGTDQTPVERTDQSPTVTTDLAPVGINLHTLNGPGVDWLCSWSQCIRRVCHFAQHPVCIHPIRNYSGWSRHQVVFAFCLALSNILQPFCFAFCPIGGPKGDVQASSIKNSAS